MPADHAHRRAEPASRHVQRRRRRTAGARDHKVTVRLSEDERSHIQARAATAGITVQRLLVESALAGDAMAAVDRRVAVAELLGTRRLVAAIGNNLNQLARIGNATGELPPELTATLHATARAINRLDAAADQLAGKAGERA